MTILGSQDGSFTLPPQVHTFSGLLLDMDGTIIDSTEAIIKHWRNIGKEIGVDPEVILATSHGRRSIDVLQLYDPSRANWEYVSKMEALMPKNYGTDAIEVPGSRAILQDLDRTGAPWAIVTSGSMPLVTGWLEIMKLAHPKHLVCAEDVVHGKPDPACYKLGREKLGLDATAPVLVLEDAPAGVLAGKAAGCKVLALATTHSPSQLKDAGADWVVRDMRSVAMKKWDKNTGDITVEIVDALDS